MTKFHGAALAVAAVLLIAAKPTDANLLTPVRTIDYATESVPAPHSFSSRVNMSFSASVCHRESDDVRTVCIELVVPNSSLLRFQGTPEAIEALASSVDTYPQAATTLSPSTTFDNQRVPLKGAVTDRFPALDIAIEVNANRLQVRTSNPNLYPITLDLRDAPDFANNLRQAATLARKLP